MSGLAANPAQAAGAAATSVAATTVAAPPGVPQGRGSGAAKKRLGEMLVEAGLIQQGQLGIPHIWLRKALLTSGEVVLALGERTRTVEVRPNGTVAVR
jgi:hypothetical protein